MPANNKTFTIKDIIQYSSPCFSCGNAIRIQVGSSLNNDTNIFGDRIFLTPQVNKNNISVNLQITYNSSLMLVVDYKTNRYSTNDMTALTKYLEDHRLFLEFLCEKCQSFLVTGFFEFNTLGFIRSISIIHEIIYLLDGKNRYDITSSYPDGHTTIFADRLGKSSSTRLDIPLMPRYKFRNRDHLLNKIKLYLTFS